jgi:HD-like signal output (HDOD) protein
MFSPSANPQEGMLERERRLLQADHAIIGGQLGFEWKLPQNLTEIIRLHHQSANLPTYVTPETRRVLLCVHIANQLVKYRHTYCDMMEIDEVTSALTGDLGLPEWQALLSDKSLQTMIDRTIQLNGGTVGPATAAA